MSNPYEAPGKAPDLPAAWDSENRAINLTIAILLSVSGASTLLVMRHSPFLASVWRTLATACWLAIPLAVWSLHRRIARRTSIGWPCLLLAVAFALALLSSGAILVDWKATDPRYAH